MTDPKLLLVLPAFFCFSSHAGLITKNSVAHNEPSALGFTENKGQVRDQFGNPRRDVLFGGNTGELIFHLRRNGLSYELRKPNKTTKETIKHKKITRVTQWVNARIDVSWPGANLSATVKKDKPVHGVSHFYTGAHPEGITNVRTYEGVTYKEIYSKIDLHFYSKEGILKYDYIVAPFGNPENIRLKFDGQQKLELTAEGTLRIHTSLGVIEEGAPFVFQDQKQIDARWNIIDGELSFIIGEYDEAQPLLIDPAIRVWGTYYGGVNGENVMECATDETGHVYTTGTSNGSGTIIATSAAHQSTITGNHTAFLVRFNAAGFREWGTYYGDSGEDGYDCTSAGGYVYMAGKDGINPLLIASSGAHQTTSGGGRDGFLVKFDTLGIRQWGTFFGGNADDDVESVSVDKAGNVYLAGTTTSTVGIGTSGSFKPALSGSTDGFLVKFNAQGVRQWGTYYGDTHSEHESYCMTDTLGNVYLGGWFFPGTIGGTIIATSGAHQTTFYNTPNGSYSYLVKFNGSGQRQWGTYYGSGNDHLYNGATDLAGNVYVGGVAMLNAGTGTFVVSNGAHQFNNNGFGDGLLVKFNTSGVRQWATFFGSTSWDYIYGCATDSAGSVFVGGTTSSSFASLFMTPNTHQGVYGGNAEDAFLGKFTAAGQLVWSTYYGGTGNEQGAGVATGPGKVVYLSGTTSSTNGISMATSNGHQPLPGGGSDGYLAKFFDCIAPPSPTNSTLNSARLLCGSGGSTTLNVSSSYPVTWFSSNTSTTVIGTGSSFSTPTLAIGSYTYYAETTGCAPSGSRTAISVSVGAIPMISAPSGSVCAGNVFVIQPTGAVNYTYSSGSATVMPAANTSYSVIGASSLGCVSSGSIVVNVTVLNLPTVTVNSGQICPGGIFTLQPQGANSYQFSGGSNTVSPAQTTTYAVVGTALNGCISNATSTVTLLPAPVITVTSGSACAGSAYTISAGGAQSYNYLPAQVFTVTSSTVFTVHGIAANSCSSIAQGSVIMLPLPVVTANDGTICAGKSFTIVPTGASTYSFSSGSAVVQPATTSTYAVTGFDGSCWSASAAIVTVSVFPVPQLMVNSGTICLGSSFVITPTGAATYSITGPSFTVSPPSTTYYSISGTSSAGCSSTANVISNVTVFPKPTVSALSDRSDICLGQEVNLTANGAVSFTWTNGPATANYSLIPNATAIYSVTGVNSNGCQATATVLVNVSTCTDLDHFQGETILIYPNPAYDVIHVQCNDKMCISVFDAAGRLVITRRLAKEHTLDVSDLAKGLYLLRAEQEGKHYLHRFIKE